MHDLENKKYVSLETNRKDGRAVKTPVWFVTNNGSIYVITRDKTGKAKRLRRDSNVRVALCSFSGKILGEWRRGTAEFVDGEEARTALKLRAEKYGMMDRIARFVSRSKGDLVVLSISLRED